MAIRVSSKIYCPIRVCRNEVFKRVARPKYQWGVLTYKESLFYEYLEQLSIDQLEGWTRTDYIDMTVKELEEILGYESRGDKYGYYGKRRV